ncbi:deoxyribodipyrimidine photo-lyase [Catenulispora pinistramenti]|uniref:cryptochrome/photolyase family protein n=1 Tax=Catenulispora pinistramenti TaxID=2705254 RepID=UPI0027DB95B4|nr:deoxyribodipyrimidine photo-lyase [Catenulispora pinistramenti]
MNQTSLLGTSPRPVVALFTRDLRVHDNPVLTAAAESGAGHTVPLFVLDDSILPRISGPRRRFLQESLADLDAGLRRLGGRLVLRTGDVVAEVCRVAVETGATEVHLARDVTGYAQARQRRLASALQAQGAVLHLHDQIHTIQPPGELRPADRDYYSVFTPYWRRWAEAPLRAAAVTPRLTVPDIAGLPLPDPGPVRAGVLRGGETVGRQRARQWLEHTVERYEEIHDDLAADATSKLSPYLHFGCLSATGLAARAGRDHPGPGPLAFLRQLCWRDFHHQVLAARPDAVHTDLRPRGEWAEDPEALASWAEGRTGIPIVDAGMRQLAAEGWMHNRARLITAGFLGKTLGIDWRLGAAHFALHLLDADVANNVLNWQWVAGTGMDTRPNRVLNPLRQAARYDPTGEYVRRYVPELADLTDPAHIHQPWRLGPVSLRQRGYTAPIVEVSGGRVGGRTVASAEALF